jgi:hypothetical protein
MCSSPAHDFPWFSATLALILRVRRIAGLWGKRWRGTVEVTVSQRF